MLLWRLQSKIAQIQIVKIFRRSTILSSRVASFYTSCSVHEKCSNLTGVPWKPETGASFLLLIHRTGVTRNLQAVRYIYTCQLFPRCRCEIFILGVLGFLKTTRSFPKIPEEVRSRPKSAEGKVIEKTLIHKIRDREEGIVIYSFYTWFSFLTWVWVNIFLEIVSSKTATTHIVQSGMRNWPTSVSRREIEVFNPQAWDSRLRRESWQVYTYSVFFSCDKKFIKVNVKPTFYCSLL